MSQDASYTVLLYGQVYYDKNLYLNNLRIAWPRRKMFKDRNWYKIRTIGVSLKGPHEH